ncbi:outer membrane beta-barrel protein [Rhodoferax sp. BAB1]|uniref:outer membrane beta-barrel protein n=1 Tax=Rhodoferax sp. BAB1 TaxID=2741720 RepID=UPI0015751649|nr:outer membrane beta-barrel protein [Rhodoferax sp. BAB1]QKO22648.1 outer membrane beta-barrel protein [Rhodoferax sp. BAB1]
MKTMKFKFLALAALTCLSTTVMAQNIKGYIGFGGGSAFSSIKNTSTGNTSDYSTSSSVFFGGARINENFAVEAEYLSTGDFKDTGVHLKASGYGLSGVFSKPVGNWTFSGKVGLTSISTKLSATPGYVLTVPADQTKAGISFGGMIDYSFTQHAALRVALSSYDYEAGAGALSGRMGTLNVAGVFSF